MARTVIVPLAIFLVLFEAASCLKCYHCISSNNTNCAEPFNATGVDSWDCNTESSQNFVHVDENVGVDPTDPTVNKAVPKPSCFTLIMKNDTNQTTIRTCLNTNAANDTCGELRDKLKQKPDYCYSCNEDNCNKGTNKEKGTTSSPTSTGALPSSDSNKDAINSPIKSAAEKVAFSLPLAIVAFVSTYNTLYA